MVLLWTNNKTPYFKNRKKDQRKQMKNIMLLLTTKKRKKHLCFEMLLSLQLVVPLNVMCVNIDKGPAF